MSPNEELFRRLLDDSSSLLAAPEGAGIVIPDDELHREIIVPLLPAMLGDAAIRGHWGEQAATGFVARIGRHFEHGDPAPRWLPGDFEIHVTASYSAGADARALADTLLSEDSLRDMTAALMNQLLDALWPSLAPAQGTVPVEPKPAPKPAAAVEVEPEIVASSIGQERPVEIFPAPAQPSRALVRALCGRNAAAALQRGLIARSARGASAAIIARRILHRMAPSRKRSGPGAGWRATSPRRLPRRASL